MSKPSDVHPDHTTGESLSSKELNQKKSYKDGSPTLNEAKRLLSRLPDEITTKIYDKTPLPILLDQFEFEHSSYIRKRCKKACKMSFLCPEGKDEDDFVLEFKNYLSMLQNKPMPESYKQRIDSPGWNVYVGQVDDGLFRPGCRIFCRVISEEPRCTELFWANEHTLDDKNPPILLKLDNVDVMIWTHTNDKLYILANDGLPDPTDISILRFDPATGKTLRVCNIPMKPTNNIIDRFYAAEYNNCMFTFKDEGLIRIFTIKGDEVEERHMPGNVVVHLQFPSDVVVADDEDGVHKIAKTLSFVKDEVIERVFQRGSRWIIGRRISNQCFYLLDDTKRRIWYQEEPGAMPILIHEDDQPLYVEQFLFSPKALNTWMSGNPHGPENPRLRYNQQRTP